MNLNESNFNLYAAANYTSVYYADEEFEEEIKRFKYLKRLFTRYHESGELKERLILNHLITLYNVFEYQAVTRMLFLKIEEKHWPILKTFLIYMSYMPDYIYDVGNKEIIRSSDIVIDAVIANKLREI